MAGLQTDDYRLVVKKAETAIERSAIERLDNLMSMGYKEADSSVVAPAHMKIAGIKSGYAEALIQLEEAGSQLNNASLHAPFSGKIEGITQKPYEKADVSKPFCTVINDAVFSVEFPLLEAEVGQVHTGQPVVVKPVSGAVECKGEITSINPRIDENGLAWLSAEVRNPGGYIEGMNVKISIRKTIPDLLVVPKQAVVLRQDRHVLFRYTKGIAYWTYLNVLDENEHSYSVEAAEGATLNPGDTIITSNNLNLAHESPVEIKK